MAYDTGWIPIVDLELGSSVASKLDVAFSNIDTALDGLETAENNIATNTSDIATLDTTVTDHETRLTTVEGNVSTLMGVQYEYFKLSSPVSTSDDTNFIEVGRVTVEPCNIGVFEFKVSCMYNYDATNSSSIFRYAIILDDGTPTWLEVWNEPKDTTNDMLLDFSFPMEYTSNHKVEFVFEAKVESSAHTLTIKNANLVIDQKK